MTSNIEQDARRTAFIFAATMAVVGSAAPIAISMGALAGHYLLGTDKSLASAPVTGFNVGVALGALPAAAILRGAGQRRGFRLGTLMTALGGWIGALCGQHLLRHKTRQEPFRTLLYAIIAAELVALAAWAALA